MRKTGVNEHEKPNHMNLDEAQRTKVAGWIREGLKLAEIQNRLNSEWGLRLTYMDVRLLVDDLKLTPKDSEPPKPPPAVAAPERPADKSKHAKDSAAIPSPGSTGLGKVTLSVDQIARPGAVVSGKVTFTDGNKADWYFDQMGRLGLAPEQTGYRPPAAELQQFQMLLENELSKMGF